MKPKSAKLMFVKEEVCLNVCETDQNKQSKTTGFLAVYQAFKLTSKFITLDTNATSKSIKANKTNLKNV